MFQKLESFTNKVSYLADKPNLSPTELKAQFDAAPDEVRQYLNGLIDALKKTEAGDSGAKNIGVTTIPGEVGNDVQALLENLSSKKANKQQENWIPAVLQNSWLNYGGSFPPVRYMKDELGMVHPSGLAKNGVVNNTIFTLPEGYRPDFQLILPTRCSDGVQDFSTSIVIYPSGIVNVSADAKNAWVSLDIPPFRAMQ